MGSIESGSVRFVESASRLKLPVCFQDPVDRRIHPRRMVVETDSNLAESGLKGQRLNQVGLEQVQDLSLLYRWFEMMMER